MLGMVLDVVNRAEFHQNRFGGFGSNYCLISLPFPMLSAMAYITCLYC